METRLMRNKFFFVFCCALLSVTSLKGDEYEGIGLFKSYGKVDIGWLTQFLPYNPLIVEAGAFRGDETDRKSVV